MTDCLKFEQKAFIPLEVYMFRSWKSIAVGLLCLAVLIGATGCSGQPLSTREKGTLLGGGIGAATGAIIGAAVGAPGAGAAIGGAIGGVGGFAVGNAMQNQEAQQAQTQSQIDSQQREIQRQRREIQSLKSQQETE
ncbi:MAG TPA: glycine zipper domain-containing protein [Candidatus Binataceae bacterium]|jgi:hypothetical protein|nr:glycine zipper domain-containing protein [Candidatus Binataceae bacterium]